ncbi:MAG: aminoacyl-tRNA hydrolase [Parachlamydiaceae bacterium]
MGKRLWTIVGLGNPGDKYRLTRHNIGFMAVDFFAEQNGMMFKAEKSFQAELAKSQSEDEEVVLVKPMTYMNLSGEAIRKFVNFFKPALDKLIVIVDDADLPFGELRLKTSGSSGGHNGLKSLEQHLGTRNFVRLKVGVGRSKDIALADYVLQPFTDEERIVLPRLLEKINEALICFMQEPIAKAMNKINAKEKKNERREAKPL